MLYCHMCTFLTLFFTILYFQLSFKFTSLQRKTNHIIMFLEEVVFLY